MASPLRNIEPSPRVRLALQLYETGMARSKKEASTMAGIHPNYLTMLTNNSLPVQRAQDELVKRLEDKAVDISPIIQELGRRALAKLNSLMDEGKQEVQLRAAIDLADRSPETSKTQKIDVHSMTLTGQDVAALAKALVESAHTKTKFAHIAEEGLEEIRLDEPELVEPNYAERSEGIDSRGGSSSQGLPAGEGSKQISDSSDARTEG